MILSGADQCDVSLLVVGDPLGYVQIMLCMLIINPNVHVPVYMHAFQALNNTYTNICRATTHSDLILRAVELGIKYQVIHNASIMNAIGCCGLQLYQFGETISIPFWSDSWKPDSFVDKIEANLQRGLHTLCLLGE